MHNVLQAIQAIKEGKMVIVIDDENRENEGDLIIAAEKITSEAITFMAKKASGLICLAITEQQACRLNLPLQQHGKHKPACSTAFTYSIDARFGVSTGISSQDRKVTIQTAIKDNACPDDIVVPGHIFPLIAKPGGVLERPGHTEAAVDLAKLAGLTPAGVICEIMDEYGVMLCGQALHDFADKHHLPIISVQDLINFQKKNTAQDAANASALVNIASKSVLTTRHGEFTMMTFFCPDDDREHVALIHGDIAKGDKAEIRIHSECLTGDVFASLHCDCGAQLDSSLQQLAQAELGILIYLRQEGRDVGLTNKIRAYHLQAQGLDTVEANIALNLPIDNRHFAPAQRFLQHFGIREVTIYTNNPHKLEILKAIGISTVRKSIIIEPNFHSESYLKAKKEKLAHLL